MMPSVPPKASRDPLPRVLGTVGSAPQCPPPPPRDMMACASRPRTAGPHPGPRVPLSDVDVALENQTLSVFRR